MASETLPSLFINTCQQFHNRVALREKDLGIWQETTWKEYYEHVKQFSLGLISMGFEKGNKLSILGDGCREWLYADLAAQCAGGSTVGVYPTNAPPQVQYIVSHSESVFIVVKDQEQADKVIEVKDQLPNLRKVIVIDYKGLKKYKQPYIMRFEEVEALGRLIEKDQPELFEKRVESIEAEDIAFFIYTSGTTGPPKGVLISHRAIFACLEIFSKVFTLRKKRKLIDKIPFYWHIDKSLTISENDSVVSYLPLCHVAERLMSLLMPCKVGFTVNFAESLDTVEKNLREISPTFFLTVPRILEKWHSSILIKYKEATWLKRFIFKICMPIGGKKAKQYMSGEKGSFILRFLYAFEYFLVSRSLQRFLGIPDARNIISGGAAIAPELVEFFLSIGIPVRHSYGASETVGLITYNMSQILYGSSGVTAPGVDIRFTEEGEILVSSQALFSGYYKDEEATSEAFENGWWRSGDIGEMRDGYLYITDRKKDLLITSSGKNLSPTEIENKLKTSPYISDAMVVGDGKSYLCALIEIEYENVGKWAQENRVAFTTFKDLSMKPEVNDLIQREVGKTNKLLARIEQIKKFRLFEKALDEDDDELTATRKMKRKIMYKKYRDTINSMYT